MLRYDNNNYKTNFFYYGIMCYFSIQMKKEVRISLRITTELNDRIIKLRKNNKRSYNDMAGLLLEQAVSINLKKEALMKK